MKNIFSFILLLLAVSGTGRLYAQEAVNIDASATKVELLPHAAFLPDDGRGEQITWAVLEAASKWQPYTSAENPPASGRFWLKVSLKNDTQQRRKIFLGTSDYEYITFYFLKDSSDFEVQRSGNLYPNQQKKILNGSFSYADLSIGAGQTVTVYMYVTNESPKFFQFLHLSLSAFSEQEVVTLSTLRDTFNLLFIGAVLIMAIYNLFLYLIVREISYVIYVAYNIAIMAYAYVLSGSFVERFATNVDQQDHYVLYTGIVAMIFYTLFSRRILQTKIHLPKVDMFLKGVVVVLSSSFVLTALDVLYVSVPVCFTTALVGYTTILVVAVMRTMSGYLPARYFLIANIFYYIGITTGIMQMLELLPAHFLGITSSASTELGVVLELAFFSLSLGAKINLMREEIAQKQLEQERIKREEEERRNELIEEQNRILEHKVEERTLQLKERNEEIAQQNEELAQQSDLLMRTNHELDKYNRDIISSINYAKRIQTAMMPSEKKLTNALQDAFLIFKPRDIVSGDFYWMAQKRGKIFIAAADCTGHGVPGALMSMIGNERLNYAVNYLSQDEPDQILREMNEGVVSILQQHENQANDGMDIAICVIDMQAKTLAYAGAMNPLLYIQQGTLHQIKGTRTPIGGQHRDGEVRTYARHDVSFGDGPVNFYIFSDGFQDQFGGPDDTKFTSKKMRELIMSHHRLPMWQQGEKLDQAFEAWKGYNKQIDDVLVMGFRLG